MDQNILTLSIYYTSTNWITLVEEINKTLTELEADRTFIFFNKEKGDAIRLLIFLSTKNIGSFEKTFIEKINFYLRNHPSEKSNTNLEPGEALWMNYPNNSVTVGNFAIGKYIAVNRINKDMLFAFSSMLSHWLIDYPLNGEDMIDAFLKILVLINRISQPEHLIGQLDQLLNKISDKSDLAGRDNVIAQICKHAEDDLGENLEDIHELFSNPDMGHGMGLGFKKLSEHLRRFFIAWPAGNDAWPELIEKAILHLGLDFRIQLYVVFIISKYHADPMHNYLDKRVSS
jgi:hypothetical protein